MRPQHRAAARDLCETMTFGSLCALGGLTPYPVLSALNHFPRISSNPSAARRGIGRFLCEVPMSLIIGTDYGTPARRRAKLVTLTIDGQRQ
jgi:NADH:ubiquinone oxidoreductase subunit F (NADH-binding)